MLPRTYESQNCSIARALEIVGERWTLLIVRDAFLGLSRLLLARQPPSVFPASQDSLDGLAKLFRRDTPGHGQINRVGWWEPAGRSRLGLAGNCDIRLG